MTNNTIILIVVSLLILGAFITYSIFSQILDEKIKELKYEIEGANDRTKFAKLSLIKYIDIRDKDLDEKIDKLIIRVNAISKLNNVRKAIKTTRITRIKKEKKKDE